MNLRHYKRLSVAVCALPVLVASSLAASKQDLERVKPVPSDQPIPLSDFFRPELMLAPAINLAGTHIAAPIAIGEDQYSLMVYDVNARKADVAAVPPDRDVRNLWWAGDQHVLYTLVAHKFKDAGVLVTEVGKLTHSYPLVQSGGSRLVRVPEATPMQPLVWMSSGTETGHDEGVSVMNAAMDTGNLIDLFGVNIPDSAYSDVKDRNIKHTIQTTPPPGDGIVTRFICDKDDALAFAITSRDGVESLHRLSGRSWEKCPVNLDDIEIIDAGNEPGQLVVLGPRQPDKPRALQFMEAATATLGEVLMQDPGYDFNGTILRDRASHKIIGLRFDRNGPIVVWLDENARAVQKAIDSLFKGQVVTILDWNRAMTRFVVGHYTDRQPIVYDWVDLEKKTAGPLNQSRPWIEPARMQPVQMFKYKTKDGRKLDAYLTLPAGTSEQNPAPLIVIPHADRTGRDRWGYDAEAQFYASRGYAVLKPNYRGSAGYNWAFPHEDEWDYVKMSEDVTAATNAAVRTKLIDRNRIAILGTEFGGYLAVCGVTNEPSLYRCAVTINGYYDWEAYVTETKYTANFVPTYGWLIRRLGSPSQNKAKYDAISPSHRADQIKVPVFIAYGKGSSPVEIGQPHALIAALDRNHVQHDSMIVNDDVHGLGYLDKQLELRERIEAFLAKNMGPAK